jgi:hypothetical protein
MREHLPILIGLVFVFGGVLLFAWWQLHEIKVDQRNAAEKRAAEDQRKAAEWRAAEAQAHGAAATASATPVPPPTPGTLVHAPDRSTEASGRCA